jgi:hypothetical protein
LAQSAGGAYSCHLNTSFINCTYRFITDSPEVTGSASNVPSSTSNQPTITPGTSSPASSSSSPSSKSNSNAGAITGGIVGDAVGGIVGGIVGVALIAGLMTWFTIRRRRRCTPSADYISSQGSDMGVVPYPMDIGRPKLYVRLFFLFRSAT